MKSSTIRRSTLSKETMEVIENLAKEQEESGLPGEYVRPDEIENSNNKTKENELNAMSQEIDLLWQNFKTNQFNTNSPIMNIIIGIIIGVAATLLVLFCISAISSDTPNTGKKSIFGIEKIFSHKKAVKEPTLEQQATVEEQNETQQKVSIPEENEEIAQNNEEQPQAKEENVDTSKMTKYVVKNGDTAEKIIKNHYGTYSEEKAQMVMKANNLSSLDRINIDQELLLP